MPFKRLPFYAHECPVCGRLSGKMDFALVKSPFFLEGRLPICNRCLSKEVRDCVEQGGGWDMMDLICQWANVPFIPEQFTKFYQSAPALCVGNYLALFMKDEYSRTSWASYEEKWKKIQEEGRTKEIHPDFNTYEIEKLKEKFGSTYTAEELLRLGHLYNGIKETYGFADVIAEDNATKMAKISYEIDRAIAAGQPIDKLVSAYNKLQVSSGFTTENAHDMNSFESISEIALFYEKIGWDKKFHNDESNDIVDKTMKNIQACNARLWTNESSMADQVETRLEQKKRIEELEGRVGMEEDLDLGNGFIAPPSIKELDADETIDDFRADI